MTNIFKMLNVLGLVTPAWITLEVTSFTLKWLNSFPELFHFASHFSKEIVYIVFRFLPLTWHVFLDIYILKAKDATTRKCCFTKHFNWFRALTRVIYQRFLLERSFKFRSWNMCLFHTPNLTVSLVNFWCFHEYYLT